MHQPLTFHYALARSGVAALGQVVLENGGGGLLDLEEQGVGVVAALQEHHERPGADAADADHLACRVDDREFVQQLPAVVAEGGLVGAETAPRPRSGPARVSSRSFPPGLAAG